MVFLFSHSIVLMANDFVFRIVEYLEQLRRRNNSVTSGPTVQPSVQPQHVPSPSSAVTTHAPPSPKLAATTPQDTPTPIPQQQSSGRKVKPKNLHCPADECDKKFAYLGWFKTHIRKCEHISPENKKDIKSWIEHEEKQEVYSDTSPYLNCVRTFCLGWFGRQWHANPARECVNHGTHFCPRHYLLYSISAAGDIFTSPSVSSEYQF